MCDRCHSPSKVLENRNGCSAEAKLVTSECLAWDRLGVKASHWAKGRRDQGNQKGSETRAISHLTERRMDIDGQQEAQRYCS